MALSSSSAVAESVFTKDCAPFVTPIGAYTFIDGCDFPTPPAPIVSPTDPPIPIPPIDAGCYSLNVQGSFHGPDETADEGSLTVAVTYPSGDVCEPNIDIGLFIPCMVTMQGGPGTVSYDPNAETATVNLDTVFNSSSGADPCDFELSLNLVLPCPTDITGGEANVQYRADTAAGELNITPNAVEGTCDFALDFDLTLPCPGTITASANPTAVNPCIARQPTIEVVATNVLAFDSSSSTFSAPTCDFDLQFAINLPCPLTWGDPSDHRLVVRKRNYVGTPSGEILINPEGSSSSSTACDNQDCFPKLRINLDFPCPTDYDAAFRSLQITYTGGDDSPQPWAETPAGAFDVTFTGDDVCSPVLDIDLNLPCPVDITGDDSASIAADDDTFWSAPPVGPVATTLRTWAFGQPTANLQVLLGTQSEEPTRCLPELALNLNLPCPAGCSHETILSPTSDQASLLASRQAAYVTRYGATDAANHPYYNKLPRGQVLLQRGDGTLASLDDPAKAAWTRTEFNESCELDLDISLNIPCGATNSTIFFHHYSDLASGVAAPPLDSYAASVVQDWAPLTGSNQCSVDEELHLFVTPGSGGGGNGFFAVITEFQAHPDTSWRTANAGLFRPFWRYSWQRKTFNMTTGEIEDYLTDPEDPESIVTGSLNAINLRELNNVAFGTGVQGNSINDSNPDLPTTFKINPVGGGTDFDLGDTQVRLVFNEVPVWLEPVLDVNNSLIYRFEYENALDGTCTP